MKVKNDLIYFMAKSILLILISSLFSCSAEEVFRLYASSDVTDKLVKRLESQENLVFPYKISKSSFYELDTENGKETLENVTSFWVDHKFSKDSSGGLRLETSFRRIEITESRNGEKQSVLVTPEMEVTDSESQLWHYLLQTRPYVIWDIQGRILGSGGIDNFADSMFSKVQADISTKLILRKKWDEAIKEMRQSLSVNLLPRFVSDTALKKGSSWTQSQQEKVMNIPLSVFTSYTLDSWNDRYASVSSFADFAVDNAISDEFPGSRVEMKGEQTAEYRLGVSYGLVESSKIKTRAKGTIQLMGRTIPFQLKNDATVTSE